MFRYTTIVRELTLFLAKVILCLKYSVKLRHSYAVMWQHTWKRRFLRFQATDRQHRGCIIPQAVNTVWCS
jgi:hypothetical protein